MAIQGQYTYEWPRPMVTTDAVVYVVHDGRIKVLLIERGRDPFKGKWAFPGGFLEMDEQLIDAAYRELEEETSMTGVSLTQMYTFGRVGRDPRGRMITVTFIGQAQPDQMEVAAGDDAADARWFYVDQLPELAFDHQRVMDMAIEWIKSR